MTLTAEQTAHAVQVLSGTYGSDLLQKLAEEYGLTQTELTEELHDHTRRCDSCDQWIESGELISTKEGDEVCDVCIKDYTEEDDEEEDGE
jgi:hypothetical protein